MWLLAAGCSAAHRLGSACGADSHPCWMAHSEACGGRSNQFKGARPHPSNPNPPRFPPAPKRRKKRVRVPWMEGPCRNFVLHALLQRAVGPAFADLGAAREAAALGQLTDEVPWEEVEGAATAALEAARESQAGGARPHAGEPSGRAAGQQGGAAPPQPPSAPRGCERAARQLVDALGGLAARVAKPLDSFTLLDTAPYQVRGPMRSCAMALPGTWLLEVRCSRRGRGSRRSAPHPAAQALRLMAVENTPRLDAAAAAFDLEAAAARARTGAAALPAREAGDLLREVLERHGASAPVLAAHNTVSWLNQLSVLASKASRPGPANVVLWMGSCCRYNPLAPKGRRLETFSCRVGAGGSRTSYVAQVGHPGRELVWGARQPV